MEAAITATVGGSGLGGGDGGANDRDEKPANTTADWLVPALYHVPPADR
jgi:hypothetical protein